MKLTFLKIGFLILLTAQSWADIPEDSKNFLKCLSYFSELYQQSQSPPLKTHSDVYRVFSILNEKSLEFEMVVFLNGLSSEAIEFLKEPYSGSLDSRAYRQSFGQVVSQIFPGLTPLPEHPVIVKKRPIELSETQACRITTPYQEYLNAKRLLSQFPTQWIAYMAVYLETLKTGDLDRIQRLYARFRKEVSPSNVSFQNTFVLGFLYSSSGEHSRFFFEEFIASLQKDLEDNLSYADLVNRMVNLLLIFRETEKREFYGLAKTGLIQGVFQRLNRQLQSKSSQIAQAGYPLLINVQILEQPIEKILQNLTIIGQALDPLYLFLTHPRSFPGKKFDQIQFEIAPITYSLNPPGLINTRVE